MKIRHGAALCAVLLLATACGSDSKSADTTAGTTATVAANTTVAASTPRTDAPTPPSGTANTSTANTDASGPAFPVSIDNQFGTTEIPAEPERVVTIGNTDGDDVLALGVTPVGIRDWYGDQPGAIWPWAIEAADGADIAVLPAGDLDFESVAALRPDLIIGISASLTQTDYDKLTAIAPTVAASSDYIEFGTPWDIQQLTIGTALGLEDEAHALVDGVTAQVLAATTDNPGFDGLTGNVAAINADGSSYLYTRDDARGRLLTDLGFVIPDDVTKLAGDLFYAQASAEQASLLDGDVLLYTTFSADDQAAVEASPLFTGLDVVQAGHAIYLDQTVNGAMSFSTTLSIPYALQAIVAQLAAALGSGDETEASTGASAGGIVPGADAEVDAVVTAYSTVFDSATTFDDKAPYLPDAESVRATVEGYAAAGSAVGGIELVPTAVTIDGDTAAVTYDVLFAGTAVYNDLSGSAVRVDGAWTITKDEFCGFMSSARNPCP